MVIAFVGCIYYGIISLMTPHLQSTHLVLLMQVVLFLFFQLVIVCVCLSFPVSIKGHSMVLDSELSIFAWTYFNPFIIVRIVHLYDLQRLSLSKS